MKYDNNFVDNSFDNIAYFLTLWKRFRNPSWKETRKNMAECTETSFAYNLHDEEFASRLFAFYNPICTLEYLADHLGDLRPSGKTYIEYIIRICQSQREVLYWDVERLCDKLDFDLNLANYLIRFLPLSEHSYHIFMKRCARDISLDKLIQQISFIFTADTQEYVTDCEEFKQRLNTLLELLKETNKFQNTPDELEYNLRKQIGEWFKILKIPYAKDLIPSTKPIAEGLFAITWNYVTFTRGNVLMYHPFHPNDKPFQFNDEKSISALNNIKSYYAARMPRLIVTAKNGYIIKIHNSLEISSGVTFLFEKYNKENRTDVLEKQRSPKDMDEESLREYIHQLKSTYLDWLCERQLESFNIYYIREIRTNTNLVDEDEDAFLFTINESDEFVTVVYENALDARSSILFRIPAESFESKVQEIHEFFSSNAVNKREQIATGKIKEPLFKELLYERVLHNDFSLWKMKILCFRRC